MRTITMVLSLLVALVAVPLPAEVPTLEEVTGSNASARITTHAAMVHYLTSVAAASPRVTIVDQGRSWEERPLLMAIITSAENHARLDEIRANAQRLGDPRSISSDEARRIIERQPAIVWLGGSIHGFELSGAEGLLALVDHLARRDDPETMEVLANSVILVDPMLNPDGRDAFAQHNHGRVGRVPNPSRRDWNNDFTLWEGLRFRTGHYFFDTNRDWWAQTQRETRHRAPTILEWRPQVVVDAHEMGSDVEFFFDPPTGPWGPHFPRFAREWFTRFGEAHARAFDLAGFEYMTGEAYNYFYPGYTTSWGSYQGAVGMLYEQGSSRGLAITRPDESVRTLADARDQQYTAAWAAVRLAATARRELLTDYREALQNAVAEGSKGIRRYLIDVSRSEGRAREVADLAARNGIEVRILDRETRIEGVRDRTGRSLGARSFPAGSLVIDAAQPHHDLIRVLFEPETPVPEEFLREGRARLERGQDPRFYDITSWSVPLLFDVDGFSSTDGRALTASLWQPEVEETAVRAIPEAGYAYLLHGDALPASTAAAFLRQRGHRVGYLFGPTRIGGVRIPAGTAIVRVRHDAESLRDDLVEAAARYRLEITPVASGLGDAGFPALGSRDFTMTVRDVNVALLAEGGVHPYSFGWTWYKLDQQAKLPLTVLRSGSLARTSLADFTTVILPDVANGEEMMKALGDGGVQRLKQWVRDGGTLVVIGDGTEFARDQLGLIALRNWYEVNATAAPGKAPAEGEKPAKIYPQRVRVAGAFVRAAIDPDSWLAAGYEGEVPVLVTSSRVFLAPEGPPDPGRRVVARFADAGTLRISGHLWPESLERLPGSVFVYEERVGSGRVIAFTEDPSFRGYWRGADRMFLNAVILGSSAP
jgi:hypothetical protein